MNEENPDAYVISSIDWRHSVVKIKSVRDIENGKGDEALRHIHFDRFFRPEVKIGDQERLLTDISRERLRALFDESAGSEEPLRRGNFKAVSGNRRNPKIEDREGRYYLWSDRNANNSLSYMSMMSENQGDRATAAVLGYMKSRRRRRDGFVKRVDWNTRKITVGYAGEPVSDQDVYDFSMARSREIQDELSLKEYDNLQRLIAQTVAPWESPSFSRWTVASVDAAYGTVTFDSGISVQVNRLMEVESRMSPAEFEALGLILRSNSSWRRRRKRDRIRKRKIVGDHDNVFGRATGIQGSGGATTITFSTGAMISPNSVAEQIQILDDFQIQSIEQTASLLGVATQDIEIPEPSKPTVEGFFEMIRADLQSEATPEDSRKLASRWLARATQEIMDSVKPEEQEEVKKRWPRVM